MIIALLGAAAAAIAVPAGPATDPAERCGTGNGSEIVVCGSREKAQRYRLPKLPDKYDGRIIRAETTIAGMPAGIHVNPVDLPGGQRSNRVMLTITTNF